MTREIKIRNVPRKDTYVTGLQIAGNYVSNFDYKPGDLMSVHLNRDFILMVRKDKEEQVKRMIRKNPALLKLMNRLDLEII